MDSTAETKTHHGLSWTAEMFVLLRGPSRTDFVRGLVRPNFMFLYQVATNGLTNKKSTAVPIEQKPLRVPATVNH